MAKELTKDERIIVRGYREGLTNIRKDINLLYEKHAKDGKLSMADLSKYNRLTNLEKNIADNLKTAYDVQVKTTKKAVKGAFESSFYYSTFELEQEAKIPLMFGLLKKEAVNAVVEGPHRWPQIAKGHTKLTNAKIRNQIMQGVVQGKDVGQVTKAVAKEMNIAASKACRIVRTETHRAQNQGSLDSFMEASKKGVLIKKVWVATLDERTRASHRVMDGQIVEVNEDFIMPGDIKASAPGLSGSASGDINCRCTIRAEVVGFTPQARRARGDGIIPQQTYQQWAKSKGIPFNKDMADEVKKLLEARGASKVAIEKALAKEIVQKEAKETVIESGKGINEDFLKKASEDIDNKKYFTLTKSAFKDVDGDYKLIADKALSKTKIVDYADSGVGFNPRSGKIEMGVKIIKDPAWYKATIRHETFHAFDFSEKLLGEGTFKFNFKSYDKKYPFRAAKINAMNTLKHDATLLKEIAKDINKLHIDDKTIVRDLFDNIFLGEVNSFAGHGAEYYLKSPYRGTDTSEAMANLYTLTVGDRKKALAIVNKYVPEVYASFEKTIEMMAKEAMK